MATMPWSLRAFSLRSEQKGKNRKNRDRDDGRPHNGVCVLGQHVAAAHAEESPGDDERHCGRGQGGKWKQVVLGSRPLCKGGPVSMGPVGATACLLSLEFKAS